MFPMLKEICWEALKLLSLQQQKRQLGRNRLFQKTLLKVCSYLSPPTRSDETSYGKVRVSV